MKKAVKIAAKVEDKMGIFFGSYETSELRFLKKSLEEFLATGVETDDLFEGEEEIEVSS